MSPIAGSEIPIAKVPGAVTAVSGADVARNSAASLQEALQASVPGLVVSDAQGNGFQTDVQFRGFTASPVLGTPQGLAVYQNGVRINEVWGDIVNWDFLPASAIDGVAVVANNPAFGLNAIGGAVSVTMKDGFKWQGNEADLRAGSFGRRQFAVQSGGQSGGTAGYVALEGIEDGGFRDFSSSNLRRMYADIGGKGERFEAHLNFTGAVNSYGVAAAAPVELLRHGWGRTFTTPQTTRNEIEMVSANAAVAATPTLKLSGLAYYRRFEQRHVDANISEFDDCGGLLCSDGTLLNGGGIATPPGPVGTIDRTSTKSDGWGTTLQAVEKARFFGLGNQLTAGASYDHGSAGYASSSELGIVGPRFVISGLGNTITSPDDFAPRSVRSTTAYTGAYVSDTLDVTDRLAVTVGARWNNAQIDLADRTGLFADITGSHTYARLNPMAGATFRLTPRLSVYGGYSEANRAPTPVELACANPAKPCIIDTFLTSDPALKQVVARTVEAGLRGETGEAARGGKLTWSAGVFHTLSSDDILAIASPLTGRGYFTNAGETHRQGIEASARWSDERLAVTLGYSLVDATTRTALEIASPNNPSAVPCSSDPTTTCVNTRPGDRLPGVPVHRFKAGADYRVTKNWKIGADLVATSDQVFRGDEANQNARLAGYTRVDLRTSYDVMPGVQIYGLIQNLFDQRYGLSGTYFNLQIANSAGAPSGVSFSDPRTITPAAPLAVYAGVRIRF
jgi:iron complex outermembrane recepter protein